LAAPYLVFAAAVLAAAVARVFAKIMRRRRGVYIRLVTAWNISCC